ncbi:hypothetical protein GL50803_0014182 [Giardia duodenalis]|uniref:Uncharacterized protein n=1 Tax=Giardia intestinalis (strain ATCC 50803 / WB clone C6) TaxID=184922 RepID=D3KI03_GIAIC|nr:hypothetical protein GL50803_0014182 [Giardia intestinalis]KAE8302834.1 hypothetical protein GL50803_0014182 [Giardia intestinalis]
MSVNTHKSWHIHREVNREKVRRLQDELSAAKDRSAKGLEVILSGESATTNELLEQVYKLGEPPLPEPIASADISSPVPTAVIPLNDELSRFDPLVYPIEPDISTEKLAMRKPYQGSTAKEGLSSVSDGQSVPSTTAGELLHQETHRMQDDIRKKFYGSALHSNRSFRRRREEDLIHFMPHNVHVGKHTAVIRKGFAKETRPWPMTRVPPRGQLGK